MLLRKVVFTSDVQAEFFCLQTLEEPRSFKMTLFFFILLRRPEVRRCSSSSSWDLGERFRMATTTRGWVPHHRWGIGLPPRLSALWWVNKKELKKRQKLLNLHFYDAVHPELHQQQLEHQIWRGSAPTHGHHDLVAHCFSVWLRGTFWFT